MTVESVSLENATRRRRRVRLALALALALLLLLLALVGVVILNVLKPLEGPSPAEMPVGLSWERSIYGYGQKEGQQLQRPTDAAVGPDGTIWATDTARVRILGFNPNGTFKTLIHTGPAGKGKGRMESPQAVGVDEDGNVLVADFGGKVLEFTSDNKFIREWEVPSPLSVASKNGRIVVGSIYGLALFDRDGTLLTTVGTRGKGDDQFDFVRGVAIADDGTIYAVDTQNRRVKAYTSAGKLLWISGGQSGPATHDVGGVSTGDGTAAATTDASPAATGQTTAEPSDAAPVEPQFQLPTGITIDGRGRLVVADAFDFNLKVLDPTRKGLEVARYGEFGQKDGFFTYPTGVGYDSVRDWFVIADTNNDRVQVMRLAGSGSPSLGATLQRDLYGRWLLGPVWILLIPLALLLLAVIVVIWGGKRARRADDRGGAHTPPRPSGSGEGMA